MKYSCRTSSLAAPPTRPRGRPRKQDRFSEAYLPARKNSFGQYQRVWVVFTNEARIKWLKLLKPGFRHCFALINDGQRWLAVEPLASCMEVTVLPSPADFNLPDWLRGQGHHAVEAELHRNVWRMAPWAVLNCVEVIKRLLGLRMPLIFTPHQLYQHLARRLNAAKFNPDQGK